MLLYFIFLLNFLELTEEDKKTTPHMAFLHCYIDLFIRLFLTDFVFTKKEKKNKEKKDEKHISVW